MESADDWFYMLGDEELGPFSGEQLKELLAQARIGPDTMVRKRTWMEWRRARDLDSLSALVVPSLGRAPVSEVPAEENQAEKPEDQTMNGAIRRLLRVAVALLAVSVILQGVMCAAIFFFLMAMGVRITNTKPLPVDVTNHELDVNVRNYDLDVNVRNSELDVNVRDHLIIDGDPIPVRVVR